MFKLLYTGHMTTDAIHHTVQVLKALADPTRLELVRSVVKGGCSSSCGSVSASIQLSQPAISHHFGKLVDAGVLLEQKDGTQKYYTVNYELLTAIGIDAHKL